jgi:hypothetical protein
MARMENTVAWKSLRGIGAILGRMLRGFAEDYPLIRRY